MLIIAHHTISVCECIEWLNSYHLKVLKRSKVKQKKKQFSNKCDVISKMMFIVKHLLAAMNSKVSCFALIVLIVLVCNCSAGWFDWLKPTPEFFHQHGCRKGRCWGSCTAMGMLDEWCWTTKGVFMDRQYVPCEKNETCGVDWECASMCSI